MRVPEPRQLSPSRTVALHPAITPDASEEHSRARSRLKSPYSKPPNGPQATTVLLIPVVLASAFRTSPPTYTLAFDRVVRHPWTKMEAR
jgi:hypothetical protein